MSICLSLEAVVCIMYILFSNVCVGKCIHESEMAVHRDFGDFTFGGNFQKLRNLDKP